MFECTGGHVGVRRRNHFQQTVHAVRKRGVHVALQHRRKRLLFAPFRMLRREFADTVDDEQQLEIQRLFRPERAVVVEHGDTFGRRHEICRVPRTRLVDEVDDRPFRRRVTPGRQRIFRARRERYAGTAGEGKCTHDPDSHERELVIIGQLRFVMRCRNKRFGANDHWLDHPSPPLHFRSPKSRQLDNDLILSPHARALVFESTSYQGRSPFRTQISNSWPISTSHSSTYRPRAAVTKRNTSVTSRRRK